MLCLETLATQKLYTFIRCFGCRLYIFLKSQIAAITNYYAGNNPHISLFQWCMCCIFPAAVDFCYGDNPAHQMVVSDTNNTPENWLHLSSFLYIPNDIIHSYILGRNINGIRIGQVSDYNRELNQRKSLTLRHQKICWGSN